MPPLCPDTTGCTTDTSNFVLNGKSTANNAAALPYPASEGLKEYGLAKDGHLLVGPYKDASNTKWALADRDMCNGATVETDKYVYVATAEFPYVLGCFGPAPQQKYAAGCSNSNFATLLPAGATMTQLIATATIVGSISATIASFAF